MLPAASSTFGREFPMSKERPNRPKWKIRGREVGVVVIAAAFLGAILFLAAVCYSKRSRRVDAPDRPDVVKSER